MYQKPQYYKTSIRTKEPRVEGETIEQKLDRILTNGEPIKDSAPKIYTKRSDGINPLHNIRTDRFELATDAMEQVTKSKLAKRDNIIPINKEKTADA